MNTMPVSKSQAYIADNEINYNKKKSPLIYQTSPSNPLSMSDW